MEKEHFKVESGFKHMANGNLPCVYPGWLSQNEKLRIIKPLLKQYICGRLADVGCGTKPYRKLLSQYVTEHIGIDHEETFHDKNNVDIFANAYDIPVTDRSFDCVLCTDVLEHLEEPLKALQEISRILREGGKLLLTVPFQWHLHEQPRDFFRYTKFGLEYLAEKAGLTIAAIKPSGGFVISIMSEIAYMVYFSTRLIVFRPLQILLMNIFLFLGWLLKWIDPTKDRLPNSYVCVFEKGRGDCNASTLNATN